MVFEAPHFLKDGPSSVTHISPSSPVVMILSWHMDHAMPKSAQVLAFIFCAVCLRTVFHQAHIPFSAKFDDGIHLTRPSGHMDDDYRLCLLCQCGGNRSAVKLPSSPQSAKTGLAPQRMGHEAEMIKVRGETTTSSPPISSACMASSNDTRSYLRHRISHRHTLRTLAQTHSLAFHPLIWFPERSTLQTASCTSARDWPRPKF